MVKRCNKSIWVFGLRIWEMCDNDKVVSAKMKKRLFLWEIFHMLKTLLVQKKWSIYLMKFKKCAKSAKNKQKKNILWLIRGKTLSTVVELAKRLSKKFCSLYWSLLKSTALEFIDSSMSIRVSNCWMLIGANI